MAAFFIGLTHLSGSAFELQLVRRGIPPKALKRGESHMARTKNRVLGFEDNGKYATIQLQLESGAQVDALIDSMRGVVGGLKQQMADAQALHEDQHDACDADLRELASGLTQAAADQAKFAGLSVFDQETLVTREQELANKVREVGDR